MAETLGSLCDKLTIVRLKQWHTKDSRRQDSLARQLADLQAEIDGFVGEAVAGQIPPARLKFDANKIYRKKNHAVRDVAGSLGVIVSQLAEANCALWHQQEKIYNFAKVPPEEKDSTIQRLAVLNLERNRCIEAIDELLREQVVAAPKRPRHPPPPPANRRNSFSKRTGK